MLFWGGLGSFISSAVSTVCSTVSSFVSGISSVLGGLASSILPALGGLATSIPQLLVLVTIIAKAIDVISNLLGLKTEDEKPEEIGMKAEEADKQGIKPENFDSYEEYIEYIRTKIQIDREKLKSLSNEDKIKYSVLGTTVLVKGIEEKVGMDIPSEFLTEIAKQEMKPEETKEYIDVFKEKGLQLKDMSSYLKGNLDRKSSTEVGNAIESAIKNLNPEMAEVDVLDKIVDMKINSRK